jgi:hypothetical protein
VLLNINAPIVPFRVFISSVLAPRALIAALITRFSAILKYATRVNKVLEKLCAFFK